MDTIQVLNFSLKTGVKLSYPPGSVIIDGPLSEYSLKDT